MKHLIKDNQIVKSGIPEIFTRENGEEFWGGYQERTDLHYEDGWRDEVIPSFNQTIQRLGERYYDPSQDIVTFEILDREDLPPLDQAKSRRVKEANLRQRELLQETDGYIIRRAETGKSVPQTILNERQAIRTRTTAIETEIAALTTIQAVLEYLIIF